jgi:hypothetical protein|tara:strand:- start:289 stop:462 length:174 start_codon:yes stop_codon:yes gene_type:complete
MNSFPGPENSWEGVDAYFTWADSPGILVFLTLVVAAICVGIIWSAARHESEVADKHK